jgi:hypothetical protein
MFMGKRQVGGFLGPLARSLISGLEHSGQSLGRLAGEALPAVMAGLRGAVASPGATAVTATATTAAVTTATSAVSTFTLASAISAMATAGSALASGASVVVSGISRNPESMRRGFELLGTYFSRPSASPDTSAVAKATTEALVRAPIPTSGKLSISYLNDLLREGATDTPTLISGFFKSSGDGLKINVPDKVKNELLMKAVRSPDKVIAQRKAFIETLISNTLIEGSPAEMLEFAAKFIGEKDALKILEPLTNPAVGLRASAEATFRGAVEANIAGMVGSDRDQQISEYIRKGLEKSVLDEAIVLTNAQSKAKIVPSSPSDRDRLEGMMATFLESYRTVFGGPPSDLETLQRFIPSATNIRHVLSTGVTNAGVANYSRWLSNAQQHFIGQMTPEGRINFANNINEETMSLIRQGMMRVFYHDEALAAEVMDNFATIIIPQIVDGHTIPLNPFLATLRSTPANARVAMETLIQSITTQAVREAAATALSRARSIATLPVRLMTRLAGGLLTGGVGLFAVMLQGTPNGGGLAQAGGLRDSLGRLANSARDRIYEWFGIQLWQTPPPDNSWATTLATAAGFSTVGEWRTWMESQARGWIWNNLYAIITTIGGAVATAFTFLRTPSPPEEGKPLTPEERSELGGVTPSSSSSSSSSGGSQLLQRKTRRNR